MLKEIIILSLVVFCCFTNEVNAQDSSERKYNISNKTQVPRINAEDAFKIYNTGKIILIDTMKATGYKKDHVLGAINLPCDGKKDLERIRQMRLPFSKNQEIFVYCK